MVDKKSLQQKVTSQPPGENEATETRNSMLQMLMVLVAFAVLVVAISTWMDSRKTPTITFTGTPNVSIAADVRGAVSTPGVVYLQPGSRMIDAINASGGFTDNADTSLINMSSRLSDGQMITVPTVVPNNQSSQDGRININSASISELKQLPGIGDVLAERIISYRELVGPFVTSEDLMKVDGISPGAFEDLEPLITVSGDD